MSTWMRIVLSVLIVLPVGSALARAGGPGANTSAETFRPDPATVQTFGPGYRYPQAGWIVLHIEGEPYERGYQHGRLMAPEIAGFLGEVARYRSSKAPADAWEDLRLIANALFLRRFDPEFLEEMKGIADGASAAGARWEGRPLDLIDLVTINADVETNFLENALEATATGLEGRRFREPLELGPARTPESHCSAFAATGPATADGQVVFGHITMWNLFHAYHYNVWLDIKPARGHRVIMQTYPGGIMSGLDYYMNDAGIVVCETTIAQTKFDAAGIPLVDRIRRALQYGDSIEKVAEILRQGNNGLYTNEWLIADTKTNEIAMFELGTHKSRLWRSSKNEWFGGTPGFYWGCNNAKDLQVRLETVPSVTGRPANVVFHPSDRDRTWLSLFDQKNKKIDVDFGFLAFTTPPLAAAHSLDAKFTTTAMARELKTWAKFGPPLGRTWEPTDAERRRFQEIHPLIGNDWVVLSTEPPANRARPGAQAVDLARVTPATEHGPDNVPKPCWHGTILPATDADLWLAAAFADFERIVAREQAIKAGAPNGKLSIRDRERLALAYFAPTSRYLTAVARRGGLDIPLSEIHVDLRSDEWYDIASGKGVLVLAELREIMGATQFEKFMDDFGRAHAGGTVSSALFFEAAAQAPRQADRRAQGCLVERRRSVEAERPSTCAQGVGPDLVSRFVRTSARQDVDRLRHARRRGRPARGCRRIAAQACRPLGQYHRPHQSRLRCDRRDDQGPAHPVDRPAGDESSNRSTGQGVAGLIRQRLLHRGGRDFWSSPHGDRRRGIKSAGCRPVGGRLCRLERRGDLDMPPALSRSRRCQCRGHAHGGRWFDPPIGAACVRQRGWHRGSCSMSRLAATIC